MSRPLVCTCHLARGIRTISTRRRPTKSALQKKVDPSVKTLAEAARLLKVAKPLNEPWAAYELEIKTKANPSQNINAMRGRIFPPFEVHTQRKKEKIVVFAEGADAETAKAAGAHVVGGQDLVQPITEGKLIPTKVLAHPNQLPVVRTLARVLGPKGLFPSEKRGTVTADLAKAVMEAKGGLDWKADTDGIVRTCIGRVHLPADSLAENVRLLVNEVADLAAGSAGQSATAIAATEFIAGASPESRKKAALVKVTLSATQGKGYTISDPLA